MFEEKKSVELLLRNSNLLSVRSNDEHFSSKTMEKQQCSLVLKKTVRFSQFGEFAVRVNVWPIFFVVDAFNSGMCFTFKTIQKTGNLLIRANEGVVYISMWKMFWLRTKAFSIHFLRFAFSSDTLGWAFALI